MPATITVGHNNDADAAHCSASYPYKNSQFAQPSHKVIKYFSLLKTLRVDLYTLQYSVYAVVQKQTIFGMISTTALWHLLSVKYLALHGK